jgi:hypothetical protein
MTLRDLTPSQLRAMQKRCEAEYSNWQERNGGKPKPEAEVWQWAWSRCLSARLELETNPE